MKNLYPLVLAAFLLLTGFAAAELPKPLAGLKLLEGYEHKALQGVDSTVGEILKKDGPKLTYDIGPVRAPGEAGFGGDYHNMVAGGMEKFFKWRKVQRIGGEEVHVGLKTDDTIIFSFPSRGLNLFGRVGSMEDLTELMMMALSVPGL